MGGMTYTMLDTTKLSTAEIYGQTLCDLGADHPEIVGLSADLAKSTKIGLFGDKFPGQCTLDHAAQVSDGTRLHRVRAHACRQLIKQGLRERRAAQNESAGGAFLFRGQSVRKDQITTTRWRRVAADRGRGAQ